MARDGFDVADLDTGLMSDPKVVALARRLRDSATTAVALTLYTSTVLASWGEGRRLTFAEALPAWWLDGDAEGLADALRSVGLLDDELRVPESSWEGWYGPARDRRDRYRALGARGGRAKAALPSAMAHAMPHAVPRPSVPSVPSSRPRAREGQGPARLGDVIEKVDGKYVAKSKQSEEGA